MTQTYPSPVDKLLSYGDCCESKQIPNYVEELGFTSQHIPDLIRMACDEELSIVTDDAENLLLWAPVHAMRALGQLRAESAIEPLINLFGTFDEDDLIISELPGVLGAIGPAAIEPLKAYIIDSAHHAYERADAASALTSIAQNYPETREQCVSIITNLLNKFTDNDEDTNAFLVGELVDLKAVEAAPIIEQAFAAECVSTYLLGDWNEVQVALGLKARSEVPSNQFPVEKVIEYYTSTPSQDFDDDVS